VRLTLLDPSQGPGESFARVFPNACEGFTTCLSVCISALECSLHAPFIASRRCRVTRCWCVKDPYWGSSPRASEALTGDVMVCTIEAWRWYSWHCCYMARHACHC
jgi:hypothetical protein